MASSTFFLSWNSLRLSKTQTSAAQSSVNLTMQRIDRLNLAWAKANDRAYFIWNIYWYAIQFLSFCRIYFFTKEFKDYLPLQRFKPPLAEFERQ